MYEQQDALLARLTQHMRKLRPYRNSEDHESPPAMLL